MTDQHLFTHDELFTEIDSTWTALNDALAGVSAEQMTGPLDPVGWSVKDHVSHMAAWNDWGFYLLQGRPGWEGLGVDEQTYKAGIGSEELNAAIYALHADESPAEALAHLQASYDRLMELVRPLDDAGLAAPFRPRTDRDDPDRAIPPVGNVLYGTTAEHYAEHTAWILTLLGEAAD